MSKFGDILKTSDIVLVDFFATWCGPCKALSPILKNVSTKVGSKAKIIKIDVDKNQSIAAKLNVRGVPTLILYKKGEQVWRQSGVISESDLINLIQQYSN